MEAVEEEEEEEEEGWCDDNGLWVEVEFDEKTKRVDFEKKKEKKKKKRRTHLLSEGLLLLPTLGGEVSLPGETAFCEERKEEKKEK